ncbi:MAG: YcaQ family DNA glycosylase [Chloroflexi bacterium]|nr:YcaQ family DNA glycosylase [Chloroflexota bacterium]
MDTISRITFRRFLLGQQGLWPGRRFRGLDGTTSAINQIEALQLDPLNIAARSQEIALHGRVLDFNLGHLYQSAYEQRNFFDYGGTLFLYPMKEFPFWRAIMPRTARYPRMTEFRKNHPRAMDEVLAALRGNGPMSNRDFEGNGLSQWSYRGRKDSAVALFYLWLLGEVMITIRKGFDRVYDLRERVVPREYDFVASIGEAEDFFARKTIAIPNLMREKRFRTSWQDAIEREVTPRDAEEKLSALIGRGVVSQLKVEGSAENWLVLTKAVPLLKSIEAGRIPKIWKPLGPSTEEEVAFLAPLDMVSARGRAKQVFDFDYVWEVYKPVHQRRWGYYTLPILYDDDLVARLDPKLDRKTDTLQIMGFWLEDDAPKDEAFANALGRGIARFAKLVGAKRVEMDCIQPRRLRTQVRRMFKAESG